MRYTLITSIAVGTLLICNGNAIAVGNGNDTVRSSLPVFPLGVAPTSTMPTSLATVGSPLACEGDIKYTPWPAFSASNYTNVRIVDGKLKSSPVDWPTAPAEINKLLPNIATQILLTKGDASGSAGGIFGGNFHSERITIDFMKYRSEVIEDSFEKVFGYGRVGAGMRLVIDLETTEANLGGSLLAIALSAKAGNTRGTISVDVIGMNAADITLSMPFTTDITESSIQKIVEALAIVKTKFHDANTTLTPQFMAKISCVQIQAKQKDSKRE